MWNGILYLWDLFLTKQGYEKKAKEKRRLDYKAQEYSDIFHVNWFASAVNKVSNLSCMEAEINVATDSSVAEPLIDLCADIAEKRFDIVNSMLGTGETFIFPSYDRQGNLYHSVLDSTRVVILENEGDIITKAYAILDIYQKFSYSKKYYLIRIHELDENGNLNISYDVIDDTGARANVKKWEDLKDVSTQYAGANHIGFGRYKSPVSTRGLSSVYGVPLNFGCSDIERLINDTMKQIEDEFKNGKSVVFADPRNLQITNEDKRKTKYSLIENIIPLRMSQGLDNEINIYSPQLRSSEHFDKLHEQLAIYEKQMTLSKGILTENEAMITGTATAVRRSNADTIALINNIHNVMDKGNKDTLIADSIFLNIRTELWQYQADYYDPFADMIEQWNMMLSAYNSKAIQRARLTKWIYPNMTDEEVQEELAKIDEETRQSTSSAIQTALFS